MSPTLHFESRRSAFQPFNPNTMPRRPTLPALIPDAFPLANPTKRLHTLGIECRRKSMDPAEHSCLPQTPKQGNNTHPTHMDIASLQAKIKPVKTKVSGPTMVCDASVSPSTSQVPPAQPLCDAVKGMIQFADCSSATSSPKASDSTGNTSKTSAEALAAGALDSATAETVSVKRRTPRSRLCHSSSASDPAAPPPPTSERVGESRHASPSHRGVARAERDVINLRRQAAARLAAIRLLRQLRQAQSNTAQSRPPADEGNDRPAKQGQDSKSPGKDMERVWTAAVKLFQAGHAMQQSSTCLGKRTANDSVSDGLKKARKLGGSANEESAAKLWKFREAQLKAALLICQNHRGAMV